MTHNVSDALYPSCYGLMGSDNQSRLVGNLPLKVMLMINNR